MSFVFPSKGLSGDSITFCSTNDNDNISVKTDEVTLPTSNARAVSVSSVTWALPLLEHRFFSLLFSDDDFLWLFLFSFGCLSMWLQWNRSFALLFLSLCVPPALPRRPLLLVITWTVLWFSHVPCAFSSLLHPNRSYTNDMRHPHSSSPITTWTRKTWNVQFVTL